MNRTAIVITAGLALAAALSAAPAQALNNRSFVSAQGSDGNPCTAPSPCRSYQTAHDSTNAGGEVVTLDSAGFGLVTITKSLTISSIGVEGAITTLSGQTAVTIAAGASDIVKLNGLTLIGGNAGTTGILVQSAGSVVI